MSDTTVSTIKLNRTHRRISDYLIIACVYLLALIVVFPIFWMVRTSFMSNLEINSYPPQLWPDKMRFSNYPEALQVFPFWRYFFNTLTITISSILGAIVTATLAGYAFARLRFPGRKILFGMIIGSMLMPAAVTIIPIFLTWSRIGLTNSYLPLIVPAFLGGGPFNIFLIRQFMMTIPRELDEAAIIDGAGHMGLLFKILIHLIKPVLITVGLFTFILYWNDLLGPVIYISEQSRMTISQALSTFKGGFGTNWKSLMAASCLSVTPAISLFFIGQKYFIEGIVLTGLKS